MYVRITNITLQNFKNVSYGNLSLENRNKNYQSSIIGLYGQNGSGKTALVDAIELLRYVLCGRSVPKKFAELVNIEADFATLSYEFRVESPKGFQTVFYKFDLNSYPDEEESNIHTISSYGKKAIIQNEVLKCHMVNSSNKRIGRIIDTNCKDVFAPLSKMLLLLGEHHDMNILVAKQIALKTSRSFIFSREFLTAVNKHVKSSDNSEATFYASLIESLVHFGNFCLFTVTTLNTGLIALNAQPFIFRQKEEIKTLMLPIEAPIAINHAQKQLAEQLIGCINIVLKQIVPDLTIGIKLLGTQAADDGDIEDIIQLMSRDNRIPLKNESEGIKKIISVLNLLIAVYNQSSITVAIDELDTGIFEYLLGELLRIISEKGKGQLIFTSHNLRPLETLDKRFVVFTTTNPKNRYTRITNVKSNNNLRDVYYKNIMLGENSEELYKPTNNAEIAFAFREASQ